MPDIRYVCLSNLHFGEEDSLLTNIKTASTDIDPTAPSPVLVRLVECLRSLVAPATNLARDPRSSCSVTSSSWRSPTTTRRR